MEVPFSEAAFDEYSARVEREMLASPHVLPYGSTEHAGEDSFDLLRRYPVVLVPGAFHKEYPQHGGYGGHLERALKDLGFIVHRVPLPSLCSVEAAGERIYDWFSAFRGGPVILVSLSKGGADTLHFFSLLMKTGIPLGGQFRLWISVCGLLYGTAAIEAIRRERLRYFLIRLIFRLKRYPLSDLDSFSRTEFADFGRQILRSLRIPSYHVVGVPRFRDISSALGLRAAKRLWFQGPSDGGGVLLEDCLSYPGTVVPILGKDHYFRGVCVTDVLRTILNREAARSQSASRSSSASG